MWFHFHLFRERTKYTHKLIIDKQQQAHAVYSNFGVTQICTLIKFIIKYIVSYHFTMKHICDISIHRKAVSIISSIAIDVVKVEKLRDVSLCYDSLYGCEMVMMTLQINTKEKCLFVWSINIWQWLMLMEANSLMHDMFDMHFPIGFIRIRSL